MSKRKAETKKHHVVLFGIIFIVLLSALTYVYVKALITDPEDLIIHTNVVYYDGKFSSPYGVEDLNTAAYILNESNEDVKALVYEYDKMGKQVQYNLTISPNQNQFIKTEGPGIVYFSNVDGSATSTVVFTRYPTRFQKFKTFLNFKF